MIAPASQNERSMRYSFQANRHTSGRDDVLMLCVLMASSVIPAQAGI